MVRHIGTLVGMAGQEAVEEAEGTTMLLHEPREMAQRTKVMTERLVGLAGQLTQGAVEAQGAQAPKDREPRVVAEEMALRPRLQVPQSPVEGAGEGPAVREAGQGDRAGVAKEGHTLATMLPTDRSTQVGAVVPLTTKTLGKMEAQALSLSKFLILAQPHSLAESLHRPLLAVGSRFTQ